MNSAKKLNHQQQQQLSGVTLSGPGTPIGQQRVVKQHVVHQVQQQQRTVAVHQPATTIQYVQHSAAIMKHCYVCDDFVTTANSSCITEATTNSTQMKVPNKIGRVVGDAFMVIVSADDVVCKRCMSLFNHLDRLEHDLERVKTNIQTLINKKYGIAADDKSIVTTSQQILQQQPPHKMQRMNTSLGASGVQRKTSNGDVATPAGDEELTVTRKITSNHRAQVFVGNSEQDLQTSPQQPLAVQHRQGTTITPITPAGTTIKKVQPQTGVATALVAGQSQTTKLYKCMSCDFRTADLKHFQPHYENCKQQNAFRCKLCKKLFNNMNALKVHTAEKHGQATSPVAEPQQQHFVCGICNVAYVNESSLRKHMETNHPDVKKIETTVVQQQPQQQQQVQVSSNAAVVLQPEAAVFTCATCGYKTSDQDGFNDHLRKHNAKVKPFKCRLCSQRFETRELASVHAKTHQPDYFKCGKCAMSFPQRELLMKHFETHKAAAAAKDPTAGQQQQQKIAASKQQYQQQVATKSAVQQHQQQQEQTTAKLLQETIDEALRDTSSEADQKIHFFSCSICSLTFIQENYYNQHMETHRRDTKKSDPAPSAIVARASNARTANAANASGAAKSAAQTVAVSTASVSQANAGIISDADIESMFEKMHSDKPSAGGAAIQTSETAADGSIVVTTQGTTAGGISFSISIPQDGEAATATVDAKPGVTVATSSSSTASIDMPMLTDDAEAGVAVSMPSLDDDGSDGAAATAAEQQQQYDEQGNATAEQQQLAMELDESGQLVDESGQLKLFVGGDGHIIHIDNNSIITTDADGNQILVQGSEQIQQILQQVGVLHGGEAEGGTFQMIQGENNQMILVQGTADDGSGTQTHQLIDASMLNEEGQLMLQQQANGAAGDGEEMHVVNEDGVHVPVSIAYAAAAQQQLDGEEEAGEQPDEADAEAAIAQLDEAAAAAAEQQLDEDEQQTEQAEAAADGGDEATGGDADGGNIPEDIEQHINAAVIATTVGQDQQPSAATTAAAASGAVTTTTTATATTTATGDGEVFFNLEDLMHQPDEESGAGGDANEVAHEANEEDEAGDADAAAGEPVEDAEQAGDEAAAE